MTDTSNPYIAHQPGDLITAEDWNEMQLDVRQDIAAQIGSAIKNVKDVDHSKNSDQLGGKSLDDLTQYILDKVFTQLPKRTGYMKVFCNLELHTDKVIEHKLAQLPLADVYQLDYFEAVCTKSDKAEDYHAEWVLFYLYHADERRLRLPGKTEPIDIETTPRFRMLWKSLLDELKERKAIDWTDDTTLDDLEVDFWKALFQSPSDEFDPDSYCHSPWFEKCCGEKRTVAELTKRGDFDDIYLKIVPQKTINFTPVKQPTAPPDPDADAMPEPTQVRVSQLDYNTLALHLLEQPTYPPSLTQPKPGDTQPLPLPKDYLQHHLPVMLLLKV